MSDFQQMPTLPLGRMILMGLGVALGAIGLFAVVWFGLRALGVDQLIALGLAVCLPPGVMTVVLFFFYFSRANQVPPN